jgi:hypothetical protein
MVLVDSLSLAADTRAKQNAKHIPNANEKEERRKKQNTVHRNSDTQEEKGEVEP